MTVVLNGATGRWGRERHLAGALVPLRACGGVPLPDGTVVWPELVLVGRDADRLRGLADQFEVGRWTTSLEDALADPGCCVYFDSQPARLRAASVELALSQGKHVLCEKPFVHSLDAALALTKLAEEAGVTNGVVQSVLFLPGLATLDRLIREGRLGRVLSARVELGYWVFPEQEPPLQRPSWNYRAEEGGGIVFDTFCHWRYVLAALLGRVERVCAVVETQIPERLDERGQQYAVTAEDSAYALVSAGGRPVQLTTSWCTRARERELYSIHVDGVEGSAVAFPSRCLLLEGPNTPALVAGGMTDAGSVGWEEVAPEPAVSPEERIWTEFLRCVATGDPYRSSFLEGTRDIQLAELALTSARESRWVELPELR